MQKRIENYDVQEWADDFMTELKNIKNKQNLYQIRFLDEFTRRRIYEAYRESKKRLLLLDYDGTLVGFAKHPKDATPDKKLFSLLQQLTTLPNTQVAIISGRDAQTLEQWFSTLPVVLIAEHGASIKRPDDSWEVAEAADQSWKNLIRPTLEMFSKRCAGSFIEEKNHTLAWHYRKVEGELGFTRSRELLDNLFHLVRNVQLQVIDGNKVIEVRVSGIDKGAAARRIVQENSYEFVMAIGDDKTDEDMFRVLADKAITVKVGPGHSIAAYYIKSQQDVIRFLNELVTEVRLAPADRA